MQTIKDENQRLRSTLHRYEVESDFYTQTQANLEHTLEECKQELQTERSRSLELEKYCTRHLPSPLPLNTHTYRVYCVYVCVITLCMRVCNI